MKFQLSPQVSSRIKMIPSRARTIILLALIWTLLVVACNSKQISSRARHSKRDSSHDFSNAINTDQSYKDSIMENRIQLVEPYKSMIQSMGRFMFAQSPMANHINIDTFMNIINDSAYMLAKPSTLLKVVKVFASLVVSFLAATFFVPGADKFFNSVWQDPANVLSLDRYLSNGVSSRSVVSMLGSSTEDALKRVGLEDSSCREQSVCYLGEILRCSLPQTSETVTKFASDNFSNISLKENKYAKAFVAGFVDRNCTKISTEAREARSCIHRLFYNAI